jgi:uncharacterized membrane protein HdeD (DUF308 family)
MDSIVERARRVPGSELSRLRWALGIQGLLWLAFGVVILVWPGISLHALVIVFGAFSLANGIVMLGAAIAGRVREGRGWLAPGRSSGFSRLRSPAAARRRCDLSLRRALTRRCDQMPT